MSVVAEVTKSFVIPARLGLGGITRHFDANGHPVEQVHSVGLPESLPNDQSRALIAVIASLVDQLANESIITLPSGAHGFAVLRSYLSARFGAHPAFAQIR